MDGKKFLRRLESRRAREVERLLGRLRAAAGPSGQEADEDQHFYEAMGKLGLSREEADDRLDRFRRLARDARG